MEYVSTPTLLKILGFMLTGLSFLLFMEKQYFSSVLVFPMCQSGYRL